MAVLLNEWHNVATRLRSRRVLAFHIQKQHEKAIKQQYLTEMVNAYNSELLIKSLVVARRSSLTDKVF